MNNLECEYPLIKTFFKKGLDVSNFKKIENSLFVELQIVVHAGTSAKCLKIRDNKIHVFIQQIPEKGKANKSLIKVLSKQLSIPKTSITIISGQTNKNKKIILEYNLNTKNENIYMDKVIQI